MNALRVGYLQEYTTNFIGAIKWKPRFVVLTNVGLLVYDEPLAPPIDMFPVIDCACLEVH